MIIRFGWALRIMVYVKKLINENELQNGYERSTVWLRIRAFIISSSDGNLYVGYMTGLAVFSPDRDAITPMYILPGMDCAVTLLVMTEDADGQAGCSNQVSRYSRHPAFVL